MPYSYYADDAMEGIKDGSLAHIEQSIFRFAKTEHPIIAQIVGDGGLGLDKAKEFMELHFYERNTDPPILAKSVVVPLTDQFLWIRDRSKRRLQQTRVDTAVYETIQLGLEFWNKKEPETSLYYRYLRDLAPGYYNLLINYFSSELGTYNDKNWKITRISPSRRELILEPIDNSKVSGTDFEQFIDTSIFVTDFKDLVQNYQNHHIEEIVTDIMKQFTPKTIAYLGTVRPVTMGGRGLSYNETIKELLREIIRKTLYQIGGAEHKGRDPSWAHQEELEGRFRITDLNFNEILRIKTEVIVGSYIDKFPEPGEIFLNK